MGIQPQIFFYGYRILQLFCRNTEGADDQV